MTVPFVHDVVLSKGSLMRNVPVFGLPVDPEEDVVVVEDVVVLLVVPLLDGGFVDPDVDDAEPEDDDEDADEAELSGVPTASTGGASDDDKLSAPEIALHAMSAHAPATAVVVRDTDPTISP